MEYLEKYRLPELRKPLLALSESPLAFIEEMEVTPTAPPFHVFRGKDSQGKELMVWVRVKLEGFVYLDELQVQTKQGAIDIVSTHDIPANEVRRIALLKGHDGVYWYILTTSHHVVRVHAATGEVVTDPR